MKKIFVSSQQQPNIFASLRICRSIIGSAQSMGIDVVSEKDLALARVESPTPDDEEEEEEEELDER